MPSWRGWPRALSDFQRVRIGVAADRAAVFAAVPHRISLETRLCPVPGHGPGGARIDLRADRHATPSGFVSRGPLAVGWDRRPAPARLPGSIPVPASGPAPAPVFASVSLSRCRSNTAGQQHGGERHRLVFNIFCPRSRTRPRWGERVSPVNGATPRRVARGRSERRLSRRETRSGRAEPLAGADQGVSRQVDRFLRVGDGMADDRGARGRGARGSPAPRRHRASATTTQKPIPML